MSLKVIGIKLHCKINKVYRRYCGFHQYLFLLKGNYFQCLADNNYKENIKKLKNN